MDSCHCLHLFIFDFHLIFLNLYSKCCSLKIKECYLLASLYLWRIDFSLIRIFVFSNCHGCWFSIDQNSKNICFCFFFYLFHLSLLIIYYLVYLNLIWSQTLFLSDPNHFQLSSSNLEVRYLLNSFCFQQYCPCFGPRFLSSWKY